MNNIALGLAGLALVVAGNACAGETGVINQAGPYEQTMQFYLHPAHGFSGGDNPQLGQHPAVLVKAREARETSRAATPPARTHPALIARPPHRSIVAQAD
jgi:hypothetical protein